MSGPRIGGRMLLAAALVGVAVPLGGAAYGYWSMTGSGAGSGTAGTTQAVVLAPGTPAAELYPGGLADVVLVVSNPNGSPVHIGTLALDPAQGTDGLAVDAGHSACGTAALSFATQSNAGAGWTVPAAVDAVSGTLSIALTDALAMDATAADACQGASITVYLAAGP